MIFLASAPSALLAAELRQPMPEVHALVDVRIVVGPGEVIERGTVVIRDGIIEAAGAGVSPPADARVHEFGRNGNDDDHDNGHEDGQDDSENNDAEPITVYPGLIEPYLVVKPDADGDDEDNGQSAPPGGHELIHPQRRLQAADWPAERAEALREAGFTTALLAPGHGLLRGQGLVANLGDGGLSGNLLSTDFAQIASFDARAANMRFPASLMGAVAQLRQTFDDARWQQQAREAWRRNPAQARPEWLEGLDALAPALDGSQPLVFESRDTLDSLRILEFIEPGGADLVLVGHGAEYQRLDELARRPVRHILPVDFPAAPDIEDENDRNVPLEELRHWRHAPDNPRRLIDAGVPVLFTTHELSSPGEVFAKLAEAVERGLDPDTALAALTTGPAQWLGLDDRAGRVAAGHMANLVVVEGELFTESPNISEVWVDGARYALAALEPPAVDPAGTWALTLSLSGMGDIEGTLVLTGPPTRMEGAFSVMGSESPLSDVRVSGERVTGRIDAARFGAAGSITLRLDIDGDRARGSGSGPFGEFRIRGRRTGTPDEETG